MRLHWVWLTKVGHIIDKLDTEYSEEQRLAKNGYMVKNDYDWSCKVLASSNVLTYNYQWDVIKIGIGHMLSHVGS